GSGVEVLATGNVAVLANDATTVDTITGGAGIDGVAGIGASIAVAVVGATTHATIADTADVTALANGAALTYVTGYDGASTPYDVANLFKAPSIDTTKVGASGGSAGNPISAADAEAAGLALLTEQRNSTKTTGTASGVIVNATDSNAVRALTVAGGVGGAVGVSLSAGVPVVTADTEAIIGSASINQGAGTADTDQAVVVAAASDFYNLGLSGSVAGGGVAGGGAGIAIGVLKNTTKALVSSGATLAAAGDIDVTAKAREDFVATSAAGAVGGLAGLAGGVSVLSLNDVTTAELAGTAIAQGNVNVTADDETRTAIVAGSVGVSGGLGLGASIGKRGTRGGEYTGADFTTTTSASGISVLANSLESDFTLAVAGGVGFEAGVSGVLSLELMNVATTADIGADAVINQTNTGAATSQDVAVAA